VSREETVAQLRLFPLHAPARSPHGHALSRRTRRSNGPGSAGPRRSSLRNGRSRSGATGSFAPGAGASSTGNGVTAGGAGAARQRDLERDREAVIRRALEAHGGPFLVIAITQGHREGWWDCDGKGHPGHPCSGTRGCKVRADVAERENERFPARRRALMNDARTYALRAMRKAGYEVRPVRLPPGSDARTSTAGLDHAHLVHGPSLEAREGVRTVLREGARPEVDVTRPRLRGSVPPRSLEAAPVSGPRAGRDGWRAISRST